MLPEEEDVTHGRWRVEGNQYFDTAATEPPETTQYTIILITKKISYLRTKHTSFMRSGRNRGFASVMRYWSAHGVKAVTS
jgi:hypothetical protein